MRQLVRIKILVGLGAALFLAGSIHAQQSVDPSSIPADRASSVAEQTEASRNSTAGDMAQPEGIVATAFLGQQATREEQDLARLTIVDTTLVVILMSGTVLIVLYAQTATRRNRGLQPS
jgi:hypothetical protein